MPTALGWWRKALRRQRPGQIIGNAALHGMVGGLISTAEHQSFLSGFLPAGIGTLGGPLLHESPGTISYKGVFVSAALGGASAVLGGGKFQNGAVTGAFSYVASNLGERESTDVTASTKADGTFDITKYAQKPTTAVLGTSAADAWAQDQASNTYVSSSMPGAEVSDSLTTDGETIPGESHGNSESGCLAGAGIAACFHDHPLQDLGHRELGLGTNQPWRLGFGNGDNAPLLDGTPNYMLNYERQLQVLEYTPSGGYQARSLGTIPYKGP